jgi:HAD superfamily hydrolase (TIGR01509 family)
MIRAVIFDLDGTLADTEPLHLDAFNAVLRERGIEIASADYFTRLAGLNDHDCFALVLTERGAHPGENEIAGLIARKSAAYMKMLAGRDLLLPGAARFVRQCAERFPLLVVTGTLRAEAELILQSAGLRDAFLDIIAAEDAARGKPAPDGFIAALGRIGFLLRQHDPVKVTECLVVEDSRAGIEAARGAGMRVLAMCHTASAAVLAGADIVCETFLEIDLDAVLRRCARG